MRPDALAKPFGAALPTTARREWWGWFGSMSWLFFMMYGHDVFVHGDLLHNDNDVATWPPFVFMLVFAFSIALFARRFGRDTDGLSKLAFFMTPIAIAMTAVFMLLPPAAGSAVFMAAPFFMAPAMARRVYGVVRTAAAGQRAVRYMSGIVACVAAFTAWMIMEPPPGIAFAIPAALALLAWAGVRRTISLPGSQGLSGRFKVPNRLLPMFAATIILIFYLTVENGVIHTVFLGLGQEASDAFLTIFGLILPPIGFLLFAIISDKGHERIGFILGMGLFLIGLLFTYAPHDMQEATFVPLFIASNFGGTYLEFFILAAPLLFFSRAAKPVFVASLGVVLNLISSAMGWKIELWLPPALRELGAPFVITTAACTMVLIMLAFILLDRHRERSLAAALFALSGNVQSGAASEPAHRIPGDTSEPAFRVPGGTSEPAHRIPGDTSEPAHRVPGDTSEPAHRVSVPLRAPEYEGGRTGAAQGMAGAGLSQEEIKVATLLIDGATLRDIGRKLNMNAAEIGQHENAIRHKLNLMNDPDPLIAGIIAEYKLTKREADILKYMRDSAATEQIAEELYIAEETVRVHVRNILKKLQIEKRGDLSGWLERRGDGEAASGKAE